jgi:hypothetical protein
MMYGKRDEMKNRSMASQKSKAKENKEMRDRVKEIKTQRKTDEAYDRSLTTTGMKAGGMTYGHKDADGMAKKGKTKGMEVKMAKGGSIDGCATKGKTKGAMVKMAMGGKTC